MAGVLVLGHNQIIVKYIIMMNKAGASKYIYLGGLILECVMVMGDERDV